MLLVVINASVGTEYMKCIEILEKEDGCCIRADSKNGMVQITLAWNNNDACIFTTSNKALFLQPKSINSFLNSP